MNFLRNSIKLKLKSKSSIKKQFYQKSTQKSHQFWLAQLIKTCNFFNFLPFSFNPESGLATRSSNSKFFLWIFQLFLFTADVASMFSISPEVTLTSVNQKEFLDFYIHFLSRFAAMLLLWIAYLSHSDICFHLNVLFHMDNQKHKMTPHQSLHPATSSSSSSSSSEMAIFEIAAAVTFAHVQPIIPLILHLENRYSRRYWLARYLPQSLYENPLIIILYALNDFMYSYMAFTVSVLLVATLLTYITFTNFSLQQIAKNVKCFKNNKFTFPVKILNLQYRQIQILSRLGNSGFASILMPTIIVGGLILFDFLVTIMIRRAHILHPVILINFTFCILLIISGFHSVIDAGGRVWKTSKDIKFQLLHRRGNNGKICKTDKVTVRAWQELRFYMGSFIYFHTATFFLVSKLALECCINLLLLTSS